jgi:hypothetical protein
MKTTNVRRTASTDQAHVPADGAGFDVGPAGEIAAWWESLDAEVRADGAPAAPSEVYLAENLPAIDVTAAVTKLSGILSSDDTRVDATSPTPEDLAHVAPLLAVSIARQRADNAAGVPANAAASEPGPSEVPGDEPMPIPSTWREPAYDDDRSYRHQMGAALLGLAAGLIIVVPTVLWKSGWFETSRVTATIGPKVAEVRTMKVQVRPVEKPAEAAAQYVTGSAASDKAPALAKRFAELPLADAPAQHNDLIRQASLRAASGDVTGAREMLATADNGADGAISFALAETYDPNMWGARDVAANVTMARLLYAKALRLGIERARHRLNMLR